MKRLFIILSIILLINSYYANSQIEYSVDKWMEYVEELALETEDTERIESLYADLSYLTEHPFDLNAVTEEQLKRLPFLSDRQIEQLLSYRKRYGNMVSIYELKNIEDIDFQTISLLLPFVYIGDNLVEKRLLTVKNLLKYGRNELQIRYDQCFQQKKGYGEQTDSILSLYPNRKYRGEPFYHSLRYSYTFEDRLQAGFVAEKDAGEPFWNAYHKGYDFYSALLFLKDINWLKSLAIGDYKMSFGQGLVISTDYLMGKTVYASSFNNRNSGIKKHSSADEYNYFRGVAATVSLTKDWDISGFYSHRSLDGVITDGTITSIYKTGLHRSQKEADKKNLFTMQLTGGHVSYQHNRIQLGITGIYYLFNRPYEPELTGYSKYNLHGNNFYNLGIDYAYRWHRFSFQGETAIGKQGWASLNRLQYSPVQNTQIMLIHRFYSYNYWAMFAHSFGEGSTTQNEQGYYIGMETSPFAYWKFFASFDLFSFPWKKYRVNKPSRGTDALFQTTFTPYSNLSMYLRYRYKQKERDWTGSKGTLTLPIFHHQLRYRLNYSLGDVLSSRTTLDYNHFHSQDRAANKGYQVTQMISSQLPWARLFADVQGSYFYPDDYDSRVYASESGLLYTFYTPSFQGRGFRCSIRLRYELNKHFLLITKFGETIYLDRNEIGSGNDLIYGNKKADVQMQLRIKF